MHNPPEKQQTNVQKYGKMKLLFKRIALRVLGSGLSSQANHAHVANHAAIL
jgi:hypothetical protein